MTTALALHKVQQVFDVNSAYQGHDLPLALPLSELLVAGARYGPN